MSKVATKQNIPNGWAKKQMKDLLDYERPDKYIVESDRYIESGTPVLTANKSFVLGYTDEQEGVYQNTPAIIFDDFTTDSKFVDFPFKIKSSAIKILKEKSKDVDLRFIYEKMKSISFPTGSHKRYYISQYQNMEFPVPPLSEQKKIAEILSTVDEEIQKTDEIIATTEKLKRGLMRQLFTNKKEKFIVKRLEDVANISTGTTPSTSKKEYYEGEIPFIKTGEIINNRIDQANVFVSDEAVKKYRLKKYQPGTILVAMYGQGKTRGQTAILEIEACTTQNAAAIEPTNEIDSNFLWFFLNSQYELLRAGGVQGHISHLNLSYMKDYSIPVPTIREQNEIVAVLSSVDEKIFVNKQLIDKLDLLKKGLMQDLLSGSKRVKI